jgi:hypothetical protein
MATSLKQGADMTRNLGSFIFNESQVADFIAIDPTAGQNFYPPLESAKWGKEGEDTCRRNVHTLELNIHCFQYNRHTIELVKLKSKWCRKSEHFCDFKTGIFAELNHVNTGGENVFLAGMEAESHVPRSTTQPPAAVPRSRLDPNYFPFIV